MPIALANIRSELLPGLFDVRGSYDMIPRQWDKVFTTHKSNMAVDRSTQMAFVALPYLKDEGAATQFDNRTESRHLRLSDKEGQRTPSEWSGRQPYSICG